MRERAEEKKAEAAIEVDARAGGALHRFDVESAVADLSTRGVAANPPPEPGLPALLAEEASPRLPCASLPMGMGGTGTAVRARVSRATSATYTTGIRVSSSEFPLRKDKTPGEIPDVNQPSNTEADLPPEVIEAARVLVEKAGSYNVAMQAITILWGRAPGERPAEGPGDAGTAQRRG